MHTFKQKVLNVVAAIPKGSVLSYKEVAKRAGSPRAFRAVGTIMKHNTDPKHIPCHRVIRSDGQAGNYSGKGGRKGKIQKLRSEGVVI